MTEAFQGSRAERSGHFLNELRATFAIQTNRVAILYKDHTFTYGDLGAKARCCAGRLRELGVEPGDRVAIATPEKLPFLAAHLGTLEAAAVSLPLNPRLTRDELRYYLQDSGARVVVAGRDQRPVLDSLRPELLELRAVLTDTEAWDAPESPFFRTIHRSRCSLPDALQLGHDGPGQRGCPLARQPRLQFARRCKSSGVSRPMTCW